MFIDFFDTSAMRITYMDTGKKQSNISKMRTYSDSFFLAISRPLDELVRPEKKEEWDNDVKQQWFVQNYNDVRECKTPGKFSVIAVCKHRY